MKTLYILLIFLIVCNTSFARRIDEMNANTSPDITNDLIYSQDVSDTTENSHGTGKSLTIKNLLEAGNITVDGTNVGINSTSPTQQFDVVGTVKATAFIGNGSGLTGLSGSGTECSTSSCDLNSSTTLGGKPICLDDGTNCPASGGASISDNAYGSGWNGDTTTAPSKNAVYDKIESLSIGGSGTVNTGVDGYFSYYPTAGTTVDDQTVLSINNSNIGIGSTTPRGKLDVNGQLYVGQDGTGQFTSTTGMGFDINNDATNDVVISSGGNLGIGSTAPSKTVDVVGTGRFSSTLSASSLTATGLSSGQCVQTTTGGLLTTTGSACGSGGGGSGTVNTGAAGYLAYYPSAGTTVDDLSILYSNGTNIGIGTTNTSTKLYVNGTATATSFVGNLTGNADTVTTNANLTGDVTSSGNATTLISTYKGWTDGGTNIYPTTTTDAVAIGTTTPVSGAILTVNGTMAGSGSGPMAITNANVGIGTTTAGSLLTVGSTGQFTVDTSGNTRVGIGTTTAGTIVCVKSISGSTAQLGYCTGSLTNSICGTCN